MSPVLSYRPPNDNHQGVNQKNGNVAHFVEMTDLFYVDAHDKKTPEQVGRMREKDKAGNHGQQKLADAYQRCG